MNPLTPLSFGALTKAAEEEYSSLPHYLTDCEEATPEVDSERDKRKKTCQHSFWKAVVLSN